MARKKPATKGKKAPGSSSSTKPKRKTRGKSMPATFRVSKLTAHKKNKTKSIPIPHSEEVDVSDGDIEYFGENSAFTGFLGKINEKELSKKVTKPKRQPEMSKQPSKVDSTDDSSEFEGFQGSTDNIQTDDPDSEMESEGEVQRETNWQDEQDYETAPRILKDTTKTESTRLPIKLQNGYLQSVKGPKTVVEEESSSEEEDDQSQDHEDSEKVVIKDDVVESKETLANLASSLIEDPEENISNLGKIRQVYITGNETIQKLALLTQLAVFRDIIPGYRIRSPTEEEKKMKTSKDVRRLRLFEETLLGSYKLYIDELSKIVKEARKNAETFNGTGMNVIAVDCICKLLTSVPHFNFRSDLLATIVAILSRKTIDTAFIKSRNAIGEMFEDDQDGRASFEAVRILTKMIKDRGYNIHEKTLDTFLRLRLLVDLDGKPLESVNRKRKKNERQHRTKKARKLAKERILIEKEMKEADASVNTEQLNQLENESLKLVFTTYLNILKQGRPELIAATLEGLAKFSHLINLDLFADLLEVLKDILRDSESREITQTRDILLCIITSFAILNGQQETKFNIDLSQFITQFYKILLPWSLNPAIESKQRTHIENYELKVNVATETDILIRCFEAIFMKRRNTPIVRTASFVKRLLISSLHTPEKSCTAILNMLTRLIQRHARLHALFSADEVAGTGMFRGDTDDPETSNPFASIAWETCILRNHYSPRVRNAVTLIFEAVK
ncbi:Nucleolar complex-associated protein 3 [Neolecta irregularis DAH-3]|uniref:Nucleolar complex-associated protein 3 n=1 Tax=Neolecta irregularis (strain DAH-3) TaxID=1198029 RepID=A0A1U7LIW1_NEOID|nr:Nucleolar complex-associated protein 3 [Neolecta irregularis DAH-3]|eukprot:OLL22461.1 Nucleolar complex-associated protein 3 [Neolecta irregularis DAH-3]